MVDYSAEYRSDPAHTFERLLRIWTPINPRDGRSLPDRESSWRESFKLHLQAKLGVAGKVRVASDWGQGIRRGDLGIERDRAVLGPVVDFVEMKRGLNRAKYTDLVTEIEGVKGTNHWTFGVICGSKTELERHYLDELIKRYPASMWRGTPLVALFWKQVESKNDQRTLKLHSTISE